MFFKSTLAACCEAFWMEAEARGLILAGEVPGRVADHLEFLARGVLLDEFERQELTPAGREALERET